MLPSDSVSFARGQRIPSEVHCNMILSFYGSQDDEDLAKVELACDLIFFAVAHMISTESSGWIQANTSL